MVVYADGADLETMRSLLDNPVVKGFTTNPALLAKAGVTDYSDFAKQVLEVIGDMPVSFEILSDDFTEMERQAIQISNWGPNVWVKIPITNTQGKSSGNLIEKLADDGVKVNVTAVMTTGQIRTAIKALGDSEGIISIFAGRIADTGKSPTSYIQYAASRKGRKTKILWASTREVYNFIQAEHAGCDIITMSPELIAKLPGIGADRAEVSLATVKQFYEAGKGYSI